MQKKLNKKYYILYIAPTLTLLFITHNTSALDYSSNANIQFTFNPTISISISDNLTIDNLSPGTAKDSNIVNVNVATNNVSGYSLSATVGTNATNDRLTNINNSSYYFTNLSSNVSDITSFNDNTWGYSYSVDNGVNWVSGSQGSTASGYNGLPLDTNANTNELGKGGITLLDTTNPADSKTIKFKIGAKADNTQAVGTYTNTINFYAITKVPPISISDAFASASKTQLNGYYTMQDMSPTICNMVQTIDEDSQTQLIDIRDGKTYWVAKLQDGHCWMIADLRITGVITSAGSNFFGADANISEGDLVSGSSYIESRTHIGMDANNNQTVWYNFCAASAKSENGCTNSAEYTANTDICPTNWRLPDNEEFSGILAYVFTFTPTKSGYYFSGNLIALGQSFYWSATAYNTHQQGILYYSEGGTMAIMHGRNKSDGNSVRCLAK